MKPDGSSLFRIGSAYYKCYVLTTYDLVCSSKNYQIKVLAHIFKELSCVRSNVEFRLGKQAYNFLSVGISALLSLKYSYYCVDHFRLKWLTTVNESFVHI